MLFACCVSLFHRQEDCHNKRSVWRSTDIDNVKGLVVAAGLVHRLFSYYIIIIIIIIIIIKLQIVA